MAVCGKYVATFAEASHACAMGMPCNADYPFAIPRVVRVEGNKVTFKSDRNGEEITRPIRLDKHGRQRAYIRQLSLWERLYNRNATRFEMRPFKDDQTASVSERLEAVQ